MRLNIRHALLALLALALLGLGVRAAWVASCLETGWPTLTLSWRDATVGWLVGKYQPVYQREPTEQADFWLRQTERILAAHPQDAEIAMGAALVLDTPGRGFVARYMETGPGGWPESDQDAVDRALDAFHAKTDQRCLELAARATELEPENPRWWRLRALLQSRNDVLGTDRSPPTLEWSDVLQRCARHDPENALYDYLAAMHLWEESAELEWEPDGYTMDVNDTEQFSLGVRRFEEGLGKRHLDLRCEEVSLVATFLRHATMTHPTDHFRVAVWRGGVIDRIQLVRGLMRWQEARARAEAKRGDATGAYRLAGRSLQVVEQYEGCRELPGLEAFEYYPRFIAYIALCELVDAHPEVVSDRERDEIESQYLASSADTKVWGSALQTVEARHRVQQSFSDTLVIVTWATALSTDLLLLVVAGVGWLVARCLAKRIPQEKARLGAWRHAVAWLVGYGLTFVVLGLAPAEVIGHNAQAWIAAIAAGSAVVVLLAWLVWFACRRRFQFSLRALFVLTFAVALVCGIALVDIDPSDLAELGAQLHVPPRGWERFDATWLEKAVTTQHGLGTWIMFQWSAYGGMYVSVGVSLALVALWQLVRFRRAGSGEDGEGRQARWRARWAATIRCVARSAAAMLVCCLLLHLALTPRVVRAIDAVHQQQMAYVRDPKAYWASVQREFDGMQSDSDYIEAIRAGVEQEMAQEAALEAEREKAELREEEMEADWLEAEMGEASDP